MNDDERSKAKLAQDTKRAIENFDPIATKEMYEYLAGVYKIKFDAYIKGGFSVEQALVLCTK